MYDVLLVLRRRRTIMVLMLLAVVAADLSPNLGGKVLHSVVFGYVIGPNQLFWPVVEAHDVDKFDEMISQARVRSGGLIVVSVAAKLPTKSPWRNYCISSPPS